MNHPHIAHIHGLEESGIVCALVMELVEGEDLSQRIARGPLPVDEALAIARQIADALEAAHEQGIVHRDVKPANVKVRVDGTVKVLDFGLAKVIEGSGGSGRSGGSGQNNLLNSPTITSPAMTAAGLILGTAAYMSPEQARGKPVDKRADIWACGVVLYEMLTGRTPFPGETITDVIAAVVKNEPAWSALPADTPHGVKELLRRCLQKDPRQRLRDIGEARIAIEAVLHGDKESIRPDVPAGPVASPRWRRALPWVIAAAAVAAAGVGYALMPAARPGPAMRLSVSLGTPEKTVLAMGAGGPIGAAAGAAISPDGRMIAFTAQEPSGRLQLWIRALDELTARALPGSDRASLPFWAPDSQSIGFFADGKLKRTDLAGAVVRTLCDTARAGGSWNGRHVILFSGANGAIWRVAATGGTPEPVTRPDPHDSPGPHRYPEFLPDGKRFLFHSGGPEPALFVGDLAGGATTRLVGADSGGVCAPSGHLLFVRNGALVAQPFQAGAGRVFSSAETVVENVAHDEATGLAAFSISKTGVLLYRAGGFLGQDVRLTIVDRSGSQVGSLGDPAAYRGLEVSPDGTKLAVHRHTAQGGDVWILGVQSASSSRLTFQPEAESSSPMWSADGTSIIFKSLRAGQWRLIEKRADGSGDEREVFAFDVPVTPPSYDPRAALVSPAYYDGRTLGFLQGAALWSRSGNETSPQKVIDGPLSLPQVSPDGQWVAYASGLGGNTGDIFVRSFPSGAGQWQVSTNGGAFPRWRADSRELYYMSRNNLGKMMVVDVKTVGQRVEFGRPRELFDSNYSNLGPHRFGAKRENAGGYTTYAAFPDGQRFVIPRVITPEDSGSAITMFVNWTATLSAVQGARN